MPPRGRCSRGSTPRSRHGLSARRSEVRPGTWSQPRPCSVRSPTPEQQGRIALSDDELAIALGAAKPIGVSISDVLLRMRRDKLIRDVATGDGRRPLRSAAPAGRRLLAARDGSVSGEEWRGSDAGSLAELIYREHRPGREGFRPAVQAIGRLSSPRFDVLTDELRASGLLGPATEDLS